MVLNDMVMNEGARSRPPALNLRLAEYPRAALGVASLPLVRRALRDAPRGTGDPVIALPGMFMADGYTAVMRRALRRLGHDARPWGLGRNMGLRTIGTHGERLLARIEQVTAQTGRPVALVGISLGGMMARAAANRAPGLVSRVVTVASPFAGDPKATHVWRLFEWVTGEKIDDEHTAAMLAEARQPLHVPSVAIWSRTDGLVNGYNCFETGAPAVEVDSAHLAVQIKPAVLRAVADALAPDPDPAPRS